MWLAQAIFFSMLQAEYRPACSLTGTSLTVFIQRCSIGKSEEKLVQVSCILVFVHIAAFLSLDKVF